MGFRVGPEVRELGEKLFHIDGVEAVILYGSYARGEAEEGSDIDLLILFKDKLSYDRGWHRVIELTAEKDTFIQALTMTIEELASSTLLEPILRDGKTLYSKPSFNIQSLATFKPYAIVTYDLSSLKGGEKVRFIQSLYGRRVGKYVYRGALGSLGGYKVGRRCLIIPAEEASKLISILEEEDVPYTLRYVWTI